MQAYSGGPRRKHHVSQETYQVQSLFIHLAAQPRPFDSNLMPYRWLIAVPTENVIGAEMLYLQLLVRGSRLISEEGCGGSLVKPYPNGHDIADLPAEKTLMAQLCAAFLEWRTS